MLICLSQVVCVWQFFAYFAVGATVAAAVLVPVFASWPLSGEPVELQQYSGMTAFGHLCGIVGGLMWTMGTILSFVAGKTAGLAVTVSIARCCPLVASLWGVWLWQELDGGSCKAKMLFAGMVVCYVAAVAFIAAAAS